jgi:hypothetical protein
MDKIMRRIPVILALALITENLYAQNFNSPIEYLKHINLESDAITKDLWSYVKASAHSGNARKIDRRRTTLIETINNAHKRVAKTPGYKGDYGYRDALSTYLKLNYSILKEDFGKIVDMEAIAEQSYDLMEAYITAKEEANKKLDEAQDALLAQQESFAANHNINLISSTDKKGEKLEKASKAFGYYNKVYLIFFKGYKQEMYLLEALSTNNVSAIEQNKVALLAISEEGLVKLDTFPRFGMDISLKVAAQNYLKFSEYEAKEQLPLLVNFHLTKEKYDKTKAAFDAKRPADRLKSDVDNFNQTVNEYNTAVKDYNTVYNNLAKRRGDLLDKWNKAAQQFFSAHVP